MCVPCNHEVQSHSGPSVQEAARIPLAHAGTPQREAQPEAGALRSQLMAWLDKSGDGLVSLEEFMVRRESAADTPARAPSAAARAEREATALRGPSLILGTKRLPSSSRGLQARLGRVQPF